MIILWALSDEFNSNYMYRHLSSQTRVYHAQVLRLFPKRIYVFDLLPPPTRKYTIFAPKHQRVPTKKQNKKVPYFIFEQPTSTLMTHMVIHWLASPCFPWTIVLKRRHTSREADSLLYPKGNWFRQWKRADPRYIDCLSPENQVC